MSKKLPIKIKKKFIDANDALLTTDRKNLIGSEENLMIRLMKNRLYWLRPLDHSDEGKQPPFLFPAPLVFVCCAGQGWEQECIQRQCLIGKRLESDQSPSTQGPTGAQSLLNGLHVPMNSLSPPQAALHLIFNLSTVCPHLSPWA